METISRLPRLYLWQSIISLEAFAIDALLLWRTRRRERGSLARLDDRLLADIGLTRLDQDRECNKPFWRP